MLCRSDSSDSYHTHHSRLKGRRTLRQNPVLHRQAEHLQLTTVFHGTTCGTSHGREA